MPKEEKEAAEPKQAYSGRGGGWRESMKGKLKKVVLGRWVPHIPVIGWVVKKPARAWSRLLKETSFKAEATQAEIYHYLKKFGLFIVLEQRLGDLELVESKWNEPHFFDIGREIRKAIRKLGPYKSMSIWVRERNIYRYCSASVVMGSQDKNEKFSKEELKDIFNNKIKRIKEEITGLNKKIPELEKFIGKTVPDSLDLIKKIPDENISTKDTWDNIKNLKNVLENKGLSKDIFKLVSDYLKFIKGTKGTELILNDNQKNEIEKKRKETEDVIRKEGQKNRERLDSIKKNIQDLKEETESANDQIETADTKVSETQILKLMEESQKLLDKGIKEGYREKISELKEAGEEITEAKKERIRKELIKEMESGEDDLLSKAGMSQLFQSFLPYMDYLRIRMFESPEDPGAGIFKFPIPPEVKVVYEDGTKQYIRGWGYELKEQYLYFYKELIDSFCERTLNYYREKYKDELKGNKKDKDLEKSIDSNVRKVTEALKIVFAELFNEMGDNEKNFRDNHDYVLSYYNTEAEDLKSTLNSYSISNYSRLWSKIECQHTYRIISQTKWEDTDGKERILGDNGSGDHFQQWKDWEVEFGKDMHGMPLEVGDDGTILLDKWEQKIYDNRQKYYGEPENPTRRLGHGRPPHIRKLTKKEFKHCTEEIDLLKKYYYINNEWDAFRDDLRDGRYHTKSLLSYDYVLANQSEKIEYADGRKKQLYPETLDPKGFSFGELAWKNLDKAENWKKSQEFVDNVKSYVMKLRYYKGGKEENAYVTGQRTPIHFMPSFDKRCWETARNWKHPGTRFYYGNTEFRDPDILPPGQQAHMSSRGISMYMIDRVLREMKFVEHARKVFKRISKDTHGFDYGPRIYGTKFPKDPLNLREAIETLNSVFKENKDKYDAHVKKIEQQIDAGRKSEGDLRKEL